MIIVNTRFNLVIRQILSASVFLLFTQGLYAGDFEVLHTVDIGSAPHGIRVDGSYAYIAVSGDDEIAVLDLASLEVITRWAVPNVPLGLIKSANGWLVAPFRGKRLVELDGKTGELIGEWSVSESPSLFSPYTTEGLTYITSEFGDTLTVFDTKTMQIEKTYATGKRPYPADITRDGVLAFVPNRDANSVSVIDLLNEKELTQTSVCTKPEGGAVSVDQVYYLVACGGSDEVQWINSASFEVVHSIKKGVGSRPFSVAVSEDGRWAFVNSAGGETISVIDLQTRSVVEHIEVGKQPIVMRVYGDRLYVTNEVSGTLSIIAIPETAKVAKSDKKNEVLILGMIHGSHTSSENYGLDYLTRLLQAAEPDYVLTEIPPNRLPKAEQDFTKFGEIREPRVKRFPEYTEALFPLTKVMDFEIIPTAGWNEPMNNYRRAALQRLQSDPARKTDWLEYQQASAAMDAAIGDRDDDPEFIHTDEFDALIKRGFEPYDRLFNDELGTGGWTTINKAHYSLIADALDKHSGEGKRFVITYGSGHKYWFLEQLRQRDDIVLLDPKPFLQQAKQ